MSSKPTLFDIKDVCTVNKGSFSFFLVFGLDRSHCIYKTI